MADEPHRGARTERAAGPALAVVCLEPELRDRAEQLARRLQAPLIDAGSHPEGVEVLLEVGANGLAARLVGEPRVGGVRVDFVGGAMGHRLRAGAGRKLPLARAIGLKGGASDRPLRVLDATLGLGRDAFLLASLGCQVRGVERCPALVELAQDGLERACDVPHLRNAAERLRIEHGEAVSRLGALAPAESPDVVYLDPMFPPRRRESALVKKEMRLVHRLAGRHDPGQDRLLFEAARASGTGRVVVKRHASAPVLDAGVSHEIRGTTMRYDVYLRR